MLLIVDRDWVKLSSVSAFGTFWYLFAFIGILGYQGSYES